MSYAHALLSEFNHTTNACIFLVREGDPEAQPTQVSLTLDQIGALWAKWSENPHSITDAEYCMMMLFESETTWEEPDVSAEHALQQLKSGFEYDC